LKENNEIWLPVKGYETKYTVSNQGRVHSLLKEKFLSPTSNGKGYLSVQLGRNSRKYVHRLVGAAFLGMSPGQEINHKDLNKSNNCVENLEIVSRQQNQQHMILNGKHNKAKLRPEDIISIFKIKEQNPCYTLKEIGQLFGVGKSTISSVLNKKTWGWE
jgi:Fic family protein